MNQILEAQANIGPAYNEFIHVLTEALRIWEAEQRL